MLQLTSQMATLSWVEYVEVDGGNYSSYCGYADILSRSPVLSDVSTYSNTSASTLRNNSQEEANPIKVVTTQFCT